MSMRFGSICLVIFLCVGCKKNDAVESIDHGKAQRAPEETHIVAKMNHENHSQHGDHDNHESMKASQASEQSVYLLESSWEDARGGAYTLVESKGQPTVVLMFYGTCEAVCPILIEDMKKIEAALSDEEREQTRFVLVSFDPENDTLPKLEALAKKRELNPRRWHVLRGDDAQVRELAAVLGVRYRKTGDGQFSHSNLITLLDRDGVVVHQTEGISQSPVPIVDHIKAMLGS
ncbi:MAG: SCO family protein [Polyangiales bacterium]